MTGGSIETADDIEYLEALGLVDRLENPVSVRPRPFKAGRAARLSVSAGVTGERVGWFIGRIGQRLFGASTDAEQTGQRVQPVVPDQWQPKPVPKSGDQNLRSLPRDIYPGTRVPTVPPQSGAAIGVQTDHAISIAHPRTTHHQAPTPITDISSRFSNSASPIVNNDQRTRSQPRTRKWIMAVEVMEIVAQASPLRNAIRRIIGPRGADVLFFGTGVAGLLLSLHSAERVDGIALLMSAAQFTLGLFIELWWVELLFGFAGLAMFLFERHQQRRASFAG